jgi:pimeloyl-ACP methyl ester carboxylesterase
MLKIAVATAAALATVSGMSPALAEAAGTPASAVSFVPCTDQVEQGLLCATVDVPLDYRQPAGPQIGIAVVEHPASDAADVVGSLFWNPGGPGAPGTQALAAVLGDFSSYELSHYNIVSFDPRGVGQSDQLQCFPDFSQEEALLNELPLGDFPETSAQVQAEISVCAQFDRACAQNGGPIQDHMGTADVARDMDRIRAALGDAKIYYDGISYGTYLGVTYANLFPNRVARMVLDGNVDPAAWNDGIGGSAISTFDRLNSPQGSEAGLQIFLQDCAAAGPSACPFAAGSYPATKQKFDALRARLGARTVVVSGQPFNEAFMLSFVTGELETVQAEPALGKLGWAAIAQTLQALWTGSGGSAAGGSASPGAAQARAAGAELGLHPAAAASSSTYPAEAEEGITGVLCGESPNPSDPYSYPGQAALYNALESPDGLASPWTWEAAPCAQWQARDRDTYRGPWTNLPASHYLVIGTLGDSNAAYSSSVAMAREVGGARLLTETGGGHTAFLNQSTCVDNAIDAFFQGGRLPTPCTQCAQNLPPF